MNTLRRFFQHEDINFLLTNRVPRITLTRFMGWFSKLRSPWLARASIALWRLFTDLDLSEAKTQHYASLHDCFTRELRPGARPINTAEELLCSPSDGIVGSCGHVNGTQVFQAKGFPYDLKELFGPSQDTTPFENGVYITLRLTSAMYHRFHAPHDGVVEHVTYLSGDTWNVNPIALKRVEKLFCRNERAVVNMRLKQGGHCIALVPVAAILVASMRLHFANVLLHLRYKGPNEIPCQAALQKGQEMGWFEHGSTIIVFAPKGFELLPHVVAGARVRMGEGLMRVAV